MTSSIPSAVALIPARAGSLRVKSKNTRLLAGHPLLAYSIAGALESGLFQSVVVSTEDEATAEIAKHYGAQVPFLRPAEFATSTSPDVDWVRHALEQLPEHYEIFSILRPTSPFRQASTIQRAMQQFLAAGGIHSIRAVEKCHEHPGKMWIVAENKKLMTPLLDQSGLALPYYARQYQDCPEVYVQNSSLEIAYSNIVEKTNSKEGTVIAPFFTDAFEGQSIDYEHDWLLCEHWIESGKATLPFIQQPAYSSTTKGVSV